MNLDPDLDLHLTLAVNFLKLLPVISVLPWKYKAKLLQTSAITVKQ